MFDEAAEARRRRWLADDVLAREFAGPAVDKELSAWFARSRVTRPGAYRLGRIMRTAQAAHDDAALQRVADRLDVGMRERLGGLLADDGDGTPYARLAADPGRIGLESLLAEIAKLERLRALALPSDLLRGLHPDQAKRFRRRAAVERAWELRRHPERRGVGQAARGDERFAGQQHPPGRRLPGGFRGLPAGRAEAGRRGPGAGFRPAATGQDRDGRRHHALARAARWPATGCTTRRRPAMRCTYYSRAWCM